MSITVYAPASIGNLGVGYDLLGAALAPIDDSLLGDKITIEAASDGIKLVLSGSWAHDLPADNKLNTVYQCAVFFVDIMQQLHSQRHGTGLVIHLEKNLPVGSGLGSSASSVVAALYGLNEYFDKPYSDNKLLALMAKFEGQISGSVHYDNIAPSFLGGIQLNLGLAEQLTDSIPAFDSWYWVVAYPGTPLSTMKMRQLLPREYPKGKVIEYGRNISAFIHASYKQDQQLAINVLKDVIAEPFRAPAIDGFQQARNELSELNMLASGISGSGPTLFSITDDLVKAKQAKAILEQQYACAPSGFVYICKIDHQGARRIH
ncbi:homoserine kinase [Parashewanella spongiae]|uniref:Homoserine kinase n=1 Tax=Parashewanella spongiae TaxID=342950 RepID=A0A3A6U238_9GAMM|nr:homoserine kinase [Parashewanella spongiae]MCL1077723.1 homoserine kinase [Parashewanella spongiae]RJY18075.1 homoserine kinase [Parashewanella spongiae]